MYKIYCDDYILYSPELDDYVLVNPKIDFELNKTGSFTFSIYPNHPNFDKLEKLKSIITVYQDDETEPLFRGRILEDEQGFYNEKQVTCEGELAFLLDSIQRPYNFENVTIEQFFTFLIENHNAQVDEAHQFYVGNITVNDPNNYITISDYSYLNTWDSINTKLIEVYGGYLWVRHEIDGNYIDYLAELDILADQSIEFGQNLLTIKRTVKGADIATVVIPLGAKLTTSDEEEEDERLTIKEVNGGLDYIYNQEAVDKYGWISKTVIFDDITEAQNLLSKGQEYLSEVINLGVSIELTAVDLSTIQMDINGFKLGMNIKIKSKPHNLDTRMIVAKLSLDLVNPASNTLTLGTTYSTFTEQSNENMENAIKQSVESSATKSQVRTIVANTCYNKNQSDFRFLRSVNFEKNSISQCENLIVDALNYLGKNVNELNQLKITITNSENKIYFGCVIFKFGTNPIVQQITSTMSNVVINANGDVIPAGHAPFNIIIEV